MSDPYISGFGVEHAEPVEKGFIAAASRKAHRGAKAARKATRPYKGRHADVSDLPGLRRARGSAQYTEPKRGPHMTFRNANPKF